MNGVRFLDARHPLVFAHKGGAGLAPENTLAAFDRAMAEGVDGLELDVHRSADGVPVVVHDDTLDRTTDASGPVAARAAAELARVDAGARFTDANGRFPFRGQGWGIPTLREVLYRYRDTRFIVELKDDTEQLAEAVAADLRAADAVERACAGSFGTICLRAIRRALPDLATSASSWETRVAVYRSKIFCAPRCLHVQAFQVPETAEGVRIVSPRFVREVHRAGAVVQVWTVDEPADIDRLLSWGVDAIISDRPDVAVAVRDAFVSRT